MQVLKKLGSIFDNIMVVFVVITALIFIYITLASSFEVVMRYFLNRPIKWVPDITGYALLFICFLGAAWVLKREGHARMGIVLDRLKPRTQALLNIITSIISAFICLLLTWYGARVTWQHLVGGIFTETAMEFPMAPLLVIIPVGSFLLFIQFLRRTYSYLRTGERHEIKSKVVDEL